ncbi:MAG: antagonist of KipI [Saprospiraceae bacterium]|jgi:antagonist of KipI
MIKLKVIKGGMFSTIQDGGRSGLAFYGIPGSGFMDRSSAQMANLLVGNKKNSSLIEMTSIGGKFQCAEQAIIAITGANMSPKINGQEVKMNKTILLKKDTVLEFKFAKTGLRTYLAIQGKWLIPKTHGSTSTYTYARIGGLNGLPLKEGDEISISNKQINQNFIKWPIENNFDTIQKIDLQKGPEFSALKDITPLNASFSISPQSDRMGAILNGPELNIKVAKSFSSQALFPGVIQCTPAGKLIVVLQDGQTTGGYPRVFMIPNKQLNLFNQLRIDKAFGFSLLG